MFFPVHIAASCCAPCTMRFNAGGLHRFGALSRFRASTQLYLLAFVHLLHAAGISCNTKVLRRFGYSRCVAFCFESVFVVASGGDSKMRAITRESTSQSSVTSRITLKGISKLTGTSSVVAVLPWNAVVGRMRRSRAYPRSSAAVTWPTSAGTHAACGACVWLVSTAAGSLLGSRCYCP